MNEKKSVATVTHVQHFFLSLAFLLPKRSSVLFKKNNLSIMKIQVTSCFAMITVLILVISAQDEQTVQGRSLDQICQDFPSLRSKRAITDISQVWSEFIDYACKDGSLLSCGATIAKIFPTR
jgi:hypothetical protein